MWPLTRPSAELYPVHFAEIKAGLALSGSGRLRRIVIESTFVLLKGIGEKTERRWWENGIAAWSDFLRLPAVPGLSLTRKQWYDQELDEAQSALEARDTQYFATTLRPRDHWRLFPLFRDRTVYLDIETTGGIPAPQAVTMVGLHAHGTTTQLVQGQNLTAQHLSEALADAPMLVTFFGSVFDVPFLTRVFPRLTMPPLHLDLCFAARRLGLTGGLKTLEHQLGLERDADVAGLDGWDAVHLWQQWRGGDKAALDRLLRYNRADTEQLVPLADLLYNGLVRTHGPHSLHTHAVSRSLP